MMLARLPRLTVTRIAVLLAAAVVGYVLFDTVGDTLLSRQLSQDEAELQHEIAELERQQVELGAIRDYVRTDAYIEGVARRVLGLVRPGETLIIVSSDATPAPTPQDGEADQKADPGPWWERLYEP